MHPLSKYLKRTGLTQLGLARKSGVGTATINKVLKGKQEAFYWRDAVAIHRAVGASVSFEELILPVKALRHLRAKPP